MMTSKKADGRAGQDAEEQGDGPLHRETEGKIAKLQGRNRPKLISKKSGISGHGYSVKKTGNATVVLVGFPSVGKSTILNG